MARVSKRLQRSDRCDGNRRCLLERDVSRLQCDASRLADAYILSERPGATAKHFVTRFVFRDVFADCFHSTGKINTKLRVFGFARSESKEKASNIRCAFD